MDALAEGAIYQLCGTGGKSIMSYSKVKIPE